MEFFFHKGRFSAAWAAKNQVEIIFRCARSSWFVTNWVIDVFQIFSRSSNTSDASDTSDTSDKSNTRNTYNALHSMQVV